MLEMFGDARLCRCFAQPSCCHFSAHRMFSTKGNIQVLELKHHCRISSHGWVGGGGQGCAFQICFHLVEKSVAQIRPAPGFVLFLYKEGTESQASLT